MKKIGIITLFAALFCFIMIKGASAYLLSSVLNVSHGTVVQFSFRDYEVWHDTNNNGYFDVGDTLSGIFFVDSVSPTIPTAGVSWTPETSPLTGNFTFRITNVNSGSAISYVTLSDELNIYYNPLGAGIDYTNVSGTGTIINYLGSTDLSDYGTPGTLVAQLSADSISAFLNVNTADPVASWPNPAAGDIYPAQPLSLIFNNTGAVWSPTWTIQSTLFYHGGSSNAGGWFILSNDPITATFDHPVPEPATIMLLGAGLLGLGSWGKKKAKKDKES